MGMLLLADESDDRCYEGEIPRLKGELLVGTFSNAVEAKELLSARD